MAGGQSAALALADGADAFALGDGTCEGRVNLGVMHHGARAEDAQDRAIQRRIDEGPEDVPDLLDLLLAHAPLD